MREAAYEAAYALLLTASYMTDGDGYNAAYAAYRTEIDRINKEYPQ
jgi:hypothetical protein